MADSKLRLSIVTALDNAGIKMTKDQIDGLEKSISKLSENGTSKVEKVAGAFGGIPGPLGKIAKGFGGVVGQAALAVGVFTTCFKVGEKLNEVYNKISEEGLANYVKGLWGAVDGTNQLNEDIKKSQESLTNAMTAASSQRMSMIQKENSLLDESVKKIQAQTAEFKKQADSVQGLRAAVTNDKIGELENEKYEAMRGYQEAGQFDAAEQLGKAYDVMIQQEKVKAEIEKHDRESAVLVKQRAAFEKEAAIAVQKTDKASNDLQQAQDKLASLDANKNEYGSRSNYYKLRAQALKEVESAQKAYDTAVANEDVYAGKEQLFDNQMQQRLLERNSLARAGELELTKTIDAYNDYVMQNGNVANALIDESWNQELSQTVQDTLEVQKEVRDNTAALADKLDTLLELK